MEEWVQTDVARCSSCDSDGVRVYARRFEIGRCQPCWAKDLELMTFQVVHIVGDWAKIRWV